MDIKWNRSARGKAAGEKSGNCRGPGPQEGTLIQLIGDPVLAPAVPKEAVSTQGRWCEKDGQTGKVEGHLAFPTQPPSALT